MKMKEPDIELDRLAHEVIGAAIEVHKNWGQDSWNRYEEALCVELTLRHIPYLRQHPIPVLYKEHDVGEGRLDLFIDNALVVELKAIEALPPIHFARSYHI